jgi:aspartate/methionine/tyrosine aminotransferase
MNPVFDALGTTIFETMSGLSRDYGAINLGQGFPDTNGPPDIVDAAARALVERSNQYPPMLGLPELRDAIASHYRVHQALDLTREQVVVTSGATEAIAATLFALINAGDEVLLFQPCYDAYRPLVERAGGGVRYISLEPPHWRLSRAAIEAAITPRTRFLLLNDPLNPTGTVASAEDLQMLAEICVAHDLIAICDEVWEHMRFDGVAHRSLLAHPAMQERAVKIGSAGKIFSLTGWKVGWLCAAPRLAKIIGRAHQFLTFTTPPNLQWAVAEGLPKPMDWFVTMRADYARSRDRLAAGLRGAGYAVLPNGATWFLSIDLRASGIGMDDVAFCEHLVREAGVAAIPVSAFFSREAERHIVRLCFTKDDGTLDEAIHRMARFRQASMLTGRTV